MQCPNCGHTNRAEAKFCEQCGNSLEQICPVCSAKSGPEAKFCSNCGSTLDGSSQPLSTETDLSRYLPDTLLAKLRSARAGHAMQGERRTVTMLFADIQGSTAAAEQMDPEDWATVANGAFQHLIAPVYRYEGTLAQIQGDAVLAFFGAPVAHEDDPIRAVRAGLEIIEEMTGYSAAVDAEWGTPIVVRVGINTGLVVVGEVGSDLRVEYTALGDAINVAARMEQTAQPGTVQVSSTTLALTDGAFEVEDLGPVEVKGKSEPVVSHKVIRFVGGGSEVEDRPIVGRTGEIERLDGLRARLVEGSGWVASIVGEAGLGKSRLLHEFRRRTGESSSVAGVFDQAGDIGWMLGASRSYDSTKPFAATRDLLARWWGISDAAIGYRQVEAAAKRAGFDDPDTAAFLGFVAGVDLPESARGFVDALETTALNSRAGDALLAYFKAESEVRPLVVVFEDVHWADDITLAFIENAMDLTETHPIGLVLALRPYREDSSWRIHEVADRSHHHRYHYFELAPLPSDETTALVEALIDEAEISEESRRAILDRADGNPLFIEEMIRSIAETGEGELTLPDSLTAMLTARLDRLDEQARYAAQVASVLGVEFSQDALGALLSPPTVQAATSDLLRRGILTEDPQGTLGFRHALIRDAAYETMLRRTRRDLHGRVAEFLMTSSPEAANDIAMHLLEAGDPAQAFPYLITAATDASRSMALADAIKLLNLAIDNTPADADPELVERAHESLGEAYGLVPDLSQAAAAYQRLYHYGEEAQRPSARVAALNHLGFATASLGQDFKAATKYLNDARALAEEVGDDLGLAEYHMNSCYVASMGGQLDKAVAHDEATVDLGERAEIGDFRLVGMVRRAINYAALVNLDRAEPTVESAFEAAVEAGAEEPQAVLQAIGISIIRFVKGDIRGAVEITSEGTPTLERFASFYTPIALRNLGGFHYALGDLENALSHLSSSRRFANERGQSFLAGVAAGGMALVYATAGIEEEVLPLREEALAILDSALADFQASTIRADLGFVSLMSGELKDAEEAFSKGLEASSTTQFMEKPRLLGGLALAVTLAGRTQEAAPLLAEAWSYVEERRYVPPRAYLHYVEGQVALVEERLDDAEESFSRAQQAAMDTGQRLVLLQVHEARASLGMLQGSDVAVSHHLEAASALVDAMAETIADETLRVRFVETRTGALEAIAS